MKTTHSPRYYFAAPIAAIVVLASLFVEMPRASAAPGVERVILTPKPPETPRINGARIFGVRPGHPFLFTIPATGQRPMTFAVDGLPKGLKVDPQTGHITGAIEKPGEYAVVFRAKNALGENARKFKIVCGDTLALTPHMGWNSWYVWAGGVSDKIMREAADAMVANGHDRPRLPVREHRRLLDGQAGSEGPGHRRSAPRRRQGNLRSNKQFPDMKALADYIHAKGLEGRVCTPRPVR